MNFLENVAKAGYGKTRQQVCNIAGMTAHDKGKVTSPVVYHGGLEDFCSNNLTCHTIEEILQLTSG